MVTISNQLKRNILDVNADPHALDALKFLLKVMESRKDSSSHRRGTAFSKIFFFAVTFWLVVLSN